MKIRPWHGVFAIVLAASAFAIGACSEGEPGGDGGAGGGGEAGGVADEAEFPEWIDVAPDFLVERLGGPTSAREFRGRPFNQSARSLSNEEFRRFGSGALVFDRHFVAEDGLGPVFNADSCLSCHLDGVDDSDAATMDDEGETVQREQGGAGRGGDPGPGLLLRLSVPGASADGSPNPEPTYGLQLQDQAVGPASAEGTVKVTWSTETVTYPDGTTVELRRPRFDIDELSSGPLAADAMTSPRIAPTMTGMGLLEAIPEAALRAAGDPDDADGDGISGRVNEVWDRSTATTTVGRFGWKAGQPTVLQQSAAALHDDMGMTNRVFPATCDNQGSACDPTSHDDAAVDLDDERLDLQVFYNRTLAVPIARNLDDPAVIRGANTFVEIGCSSCHTTTQRSGPDEVAGLANVEFHPFTDLLLHDMGPGLADGRPEFGASGSEWRTPPLWTVGRRGEVTGFENFLHDGRARTIEEAILWHGGEAEAVRGRFMALAQRRRHDLIEFIGAL
ncbi:MAG: di-heme oxidoredictase family protein [Microthrixaceae bacterium]|nr:thiol oxidoreductase [Microthrixaceae bacterium]